MFFIIWTALRTSRRILHEGNTNKHEVSERYIEWGHSEQEDSNEEHVPNEGATLLLHGHGSSLTWT